jgi:hypothetical protein
MPAPTPQIVHVSGNTERDTPTPHSTSTPFPWCDRLMTMGRSSESVSVPGDGNCMLHAYMATCGIDAPCVDGLLRLMCDILNATTPASTWRRDYHFDMQDSGNVAYEAECWEAVVAMAAPRLSQPPYLREIHTRALAIATGTTIVALSKNSMLRNQVGGVDTYRAPDLITIFLPSPDCAYEGVRTEMAASSRSGPVFKKYPGNKYSWDGFKSIWDELPDHDKCGWCVIIYDGNALHYEGTSIA